jgi:hypothetical protein
MLFFKILSLDYRTVKKVYSPKATSKSATPKSATPNNGRGKMAEEK